MGQGEPRHQEVQSQDETVPSKYLEHFRVRGWADDCRIRGDTGLGRAGVFGGNQGLFAISVNFPVAGYLILSKKGQSEG